MELETFLELKNMAIQLATEKSACDSQLKRVVNSNSFAELCEVIKDNFNWCCNTGILTAEIILKYDKHFADNKIFANVNITEGFLLASDSATVEAYDSATVMAFDSATVEAFDSATVEAYGSATVEAFDSATVEAFGSATVRAYGSATVEAYGSAYIQCRTTIECKISDNVIIRRTDTNTIEYCGNMDIKKV
jgi:hypothetical protein